MRDFLLRVLLPLTLCGGAFALLVWLCAPLLRRLAGVVQKAALLLAAVLFVLPVWLPSTGGKTAETPTPLEQTLLSAPVSSVSYQAAQSLSAAAEESAAGANARSAASAEQWIFLAYLCGAAAFGALALARGLRFYKTARRALKPASAQQLALFGALKRELGVKRRVGLGVCGPLKSPVLFGLLRPTIALPAGEIEEQALEFALRHELTHLRAGDLVTKLFVQFVWLLHWFNPAAWLLRSAFEASCERCCDESVLAGASRARRLAYGNALLGFCETPRPYATSGFNLPAHRLKGRLRQLVRPRRLGRALHVMGVVGLCALLAISLLAGCGFAAGGAGEGQGSQPPIPNDSAADGDTADGDSGANIAGVDSDTDGIPDDFSLGWPTGTPFAVSRGYTQYHDGIDIAGEDGLAVYAAETGVVTTVVYDDPNDGIYIVIDHGNGVQTRYTNNGACSVAQGDTVARGQVIATMGISGNSTGPHLHFEVLVDGESVDPSPYLGL